MEIPAPRLWEDPVRGGYIAPDDFLRLTGLEVLDGFNRRSRLPPPIHFLTGMQFEHASLGSATFTMPVTDWLLAPQGVVSGSALSFLVDGPLGCAVQTTLPAATPYTTSGMSLNFLRPVRRTGGLLTAVGSLVHAGRTVLLADDLKVYFLRPVAPDGRDLVATATLVHRGRTTAVATSQVHDQDGRLVATAIGSAHFLPGRPPSLATLETGEPYSDTA
jgi:uncharacterized protein (TIGR00369 family)